VNINSPSYTPSVDLKILNSKIFAEIEINLKQYDVFFIMIDGYYNE